MATPFEINQTKTLQAIEKARQEAQQQQQQNQDAQLSARRTQLQAEANTYNRGGKNYGRQYSPEFQQRVNQYNDEITARNTRYETQRNSITGGVTQVVAEPVKTNVGSEIANAVPGTRNIYVPYGNYRQIEMKNAKTAIDKNTGEIAIYQERGGLAGKLNPGKYVLTGGGGRNAAQSGTFSFDAPLTPAVFRQDSGKILKYSPLADLNLSQFVLANKGGVSRLGAEAYGGFVLPLDTRTIQSTGAKYSTFSDKNNLANFANPQGVNIPKSLNPGARIPWEINKKNAAISYMNSKGVFSDAIKETKMVAKASPSRSISTNLTLGGLSVVGIKTKAEQFGTSVIVPSEFHNMAASVGVFSSPKATSAFRMTEALAENPVLGGLIKLPTSLYFGKDIFQTNLETTVVGKPVAKGEAVTTYGNPWKEIKDLGNGVQEVTTYTPSTRVQQYETPITKVTTPLLTPTALMEKRVSRNIQFLKGNEIKPSDGLVTSFSKGFANMLIEKPLTAVEYAAAGAIMVAGGEAIAALGTSTQIGAAAQGSFNLARVARATTFLSTKAAPVALTSLYGADIAATGLQPTTERGGLLGGKYSFNPTPGSFYKMGGRVSTEAIPMVAGAAGYSYLKTASFPSFDLSGKRSGATVKGGSSPSLSYSSKATPVWNEQFKGFTYAKGAGIRVYGEPFSAEGMQGDYIFNRAALGIGKERMGFVYVPGAGKVIDLTVKTPKLFEGFGKPAMREVYQPSLTSTPPTESALGGVRIRLSPAIEGGYSPKLLTSPVTIKSLAAIKAFTPKVEPIVSPREFVVPKVSEEGSFWKYQRQRLQTVEIPTFDLRTVYDLRGPEPLMRMERAAPKVSTKPYMEPIRLNIRTEAEVLGVSVLEARTITRVKTPKAVSDSFWEWQRSRSRANLTGVSLRLGRQMGLKSDVLTQTRTKTATGTISLQEYLTKPMTSTKVKTQTMPEVFTLTMPETAVRMMEQQAVSERTIFATAPLTSRITAPITTTIPKTIITPKIIPDITKIITPAIPPGVFDFGSGLGGYLLRKRKRTRWEIGTFGLDIGGMNSLKLFRKPVKVNLFGSPRKRGTKRRKKK